MRGATTAYAVVWSGDRGSGSGRLDLRPGRIELTGRGAPLVLAREDVVSVAIGRRRDERVRGLPALLLRLRDGGELRVASLEGVGALHELNRRLDRRPLRLAL